MPLTRRERVRAATIDEIKQTARQQMAAQGAASLSLRAIAREMGMTAPALYRYFASRDDLVTALIVDAYNSLTAALVASQESAEESYAERVMASARAYRSWALAHPEEYSLIFGTPIPNYHAPMESTAPAATGSMSVLLNVLDAAWQNGALKTEGVLSSTSEMIQGWVEKFSYTGSPVVIHLAMASWVQIHGIVSLELYGHLSAIPEEVRIDTFFETEIQAMIARMGLGI